MIPYCYFGQKIAVRDSRFWNPDTNTKMKAVVYFGADTTLVFASAFATVALPAFSEY